METFLSCAANQINILEGSGIDIPDLDVAVTRLAALPDSYKSWIQLLSQVSEEKLTYKFVKPGLLTEINHCSKKESKLMERETMLLAKAKT